MSEAKEFKGNNHIFRKNKNLSMQDNFIFVDTESNIEQIHKKTKKLTFKLGCAIFWNRLIDVKKKMTFYDISDFWIRVNDCFDNEHKQHIMFAHNMQFDFKMLNGFNELTEHGWELQNHYVRNKTYILLFKKNDYFLHIWDTTNFVSYGLDDLGKVVGFPKLKIDFKKCSNNELEIYCMRDTEILYQFILNLINFLLENDLSRLKATASSLSFNTFRHKFYNQKDSTIWIHDFKRAILLERLSYRGGITDVFRLGKCEEIYKTDINSHYPKSMRDKQLPTKLIYHSHESDKKLCDLKDNDLSVANLSDKQYDKISKNLMNVYNSFKKTHGIIARITAFLPKKYAYILNDFGLKKGSFAWGKIEVVLCSPELKFIERYGKILKIHEINVYETKQIFKEFVDFFYGLKAKFSKEGNKVYKEICKLFLNGFYGKWGQKEFISEQLNNEHKYLIRNQDAILEIVKSKKDLIKQSSFVYLGSLNSKELYVINKKLHISYNTKNNSKESFVAISSFITSQSRMNLVDFIFIAKRKNLIYTDTDSLFVDKKGYKNLLKANCFDDYELGKLKSLGYGYGQFYNPKFYDFYDYDKMKKKNYKFRKCKGINQEKAIVLSEDFNHVKYQVELWDKFKSSMKNGNFSTQLINDVEKVMSKKYDKQKVLVNGYTEAFHVSEIK